MRRLTFGGYLEQYVRSLSSNSTNGIFKLAKEASTNYRLREPLFLYALHAGKMHLLLKSTRESLLLSQYAEIAAKYSWLDMLHALESKDETINRNYHKVYRSYVSRRDTPETNSKTKALLHRRIRHLQDIKNVTNYRLYTDLRLNPSNVNAFLKNGDANKLSLDKARKLLDYLENRNIS